MTRIHIKNGHLVDPAHQVDKPKDLFISDGQVVATGKAPDGFQADEVINAGGKFVFVGNGPGRGDNTDGVAPLDGGG